MDLVKTFRKTSQGKIEGYRAPVRCRSRDLARLSSKYIGITLMGSNDLQGELDKAIKPPMTVNQNYHLAR